MFMFGKLLLLLKPMPSFMLSFPADHNQVKINYGWLGVVVV